MHLRKAASIAAVCLAAVGVNAEPDMSFSGYLDADVWTDLAGNYFTNSEFDLGLSLKFSEEVSANLYATINQLNSASGVGRIPAGGGSPSERWITANFDGFDISYASPIGTFSVGDLVYQFGGFNYYFYKRLSMITPENFTRGVKYSNTFGPVTQTLLAGVADIDNNSGDVLGTTEFSLGGQSVKAIYGVRGSAITSFDDGFNLVGGVEYEGTLGEMLSVKADVGYLGLPGETRTNIFTFLVEPSLSFGKASVAGTFYAMLDADSVNDALSALGLPLYGIGDEMFAYVEPGYSFSDVIAAGLPIEYHAGLLDDENDNQFWVVPTMYVYPTDGVEWWLWGQVVVPTAENSDLLYGLGSEIIVKF